MKRNHKMRRRKPDLLALLMRCTPVDTPGGRLWLTGPANAKAIREYRRKYPGRT